MSLADEYLNIREQRGSKRKPRGGGGKQNFNIDRQFPSWPGDEPNPANVIPVGMGIEPEDALIEEEPKDIASMFTVRDDSDPGAGARAGRVADEEALSGGAPNIRRRIGAEAPSYQSGVMTLLEGQRPAPLPSLEEARANAVGERQRRLDDARFGLDPGTFGPFEPAIVAISEGIRAQRPDRLPGSNMRNVFEGLNYALLADPSTGRRDPVSRRNFDYQYGAPWGANEPGEDGLTDEQRGNRRLADSMDPTFLGEDEITVTAPSRPESFTEAAAGLLTQDSWETPEDRRQGLANPFLAVGDFASDLWTMPGEAQEEQAMREAGALFDYGLSGRESDLRRAQVAAAEYGVNAGTSAIELTPAGFAGDVASLGRVGARGVAREATDALPARRLGEDAPMGFEGAPRPQAEPIDAEFRPAPQRAFQAAVRDPETGRTYTGLDHMEAIDSAPDAATRARLEQIYNAPTEDPSAVGFVVNGQFMSREDGLQALRAQRAPRQQRGGETLNWLGHDRTLRDNGVTVRPLGPGAEVTDPDAAGFIWRNADGSFVHENADMVETGPYSAWAQRMRAPEGRVRIGEQVNRDGSVTERDPIDWDAPVAPERSALRDLGLGAAAGVGAGFGADALLNQEANADDGEQGDRSEPLLPILGGVAGAALASRGGRNMRSQVNMFAGPNARTADRAALTRAQEMAASGASRDEIWANTGWFQGVDGKWRFEIDDSQSQMTLQPGSNYGRLNEVIDHPELFEAYPQFDAIQASTHGAKRPSGSYTAARERPVGWGGSGGFVTDPPTLVANGSTPGSLRATTLHEGQHAIQAEEGFARGGAVRTVLTTDQLAEIDHLKHALRTQPRGEARNEMVARHNAIVQEGHDGYRRLAGEVESRNVEKRRNLTPTQRQKRPPWSTQDVPDDQQIIRFDGGRAESRRLGEPEDSAPADRAPQRPWTEADITRAQEMRAEGATVRAIGEELGRSAGDVSRRLSAGLAPPKARGFDPRLSPDEGYAAQRRLAGLTPAQIADEMELPSGQVRVALHEARRKAPDLSIPSIAIGAGIGGAVAFGDEAYAQLAGEDGIIEIAGMQIDPNGDPPSFRSAQGAPTVSGEYMIQEFGDGSRHVFRMDRSGDRLNPEYVGELIGTASSAPRLGEGSGRVLSEGVTESRLPPPMEDQTQNELPEWARIAGGIGAGVLARSSARRIGLRGIGADAPAFGAAFGVDTIMGGDRGEALFTGAAAPLSARLLSQGGEVVARAYDNFDDPRRSPMQSEALLRDPQFIMRRNEFAQTLPSAAPRARRLAVERDPLDGYASGRDPNGRVTDAAEVAEQGYYRDAAPQAVPPRVEFDTLPPAEQLAWMDRVGFDAPRAPAVPDRGNMGFVDGSSPEVEQVRRLGAPERADPFLQPSTGRSVFGEPRQPRVKAPPPRLEQRAAERGSTGAMQGVTVGPMREIATDLGIATDGVKAPELRRTLVRELARRFDSTAELVAFLRGYGVTAAALGIGLGGAQMVTEPEVRM